MFMIISSTSKKQEILPTNLPIHIYVNRIISRLVLKIEGGYKLLQKSKTMKLTSSRKKLIDKTKNGENVESFKVVEVVFVQYNLVDNQF